MIDETTENRFREYMAQMEAPCPRNAAVFVGGELRGDFELTWRRIVQDEDVQKVLRRMLFIPGDVPDSRGWTLLDVLGHLSGRPPKKSLELFEDVVVAEALITSMDVVRDGEGPTYRVRYTYGPGRRFEGKTAPGYDSMHTSLNGWEQKALDAYWTAGQLIACRYRESDPTAHCVYHP